MSGRKSKLDGVHPLLIEAILAVHKEMLVDHDHVMIVTDGVRTAEEQYELYQQGRRRPGKIVTYCDGYVKKSNHQPWADGFGHAVDCCFIIGGKASWADELPWDIYGALAKKHHLSWGGYWPKEKMDRPHVELLNVELLNTEVKTRAKS